MPCFIPFSSHADVRSQENDGKGHPLLRLSPPTVAVGSFSQLSKLVQLAGDRGLTEVVACLEGMARGNRKDQI
jgi:hypothetical protein